MKKQITPLEGETKEMGITPEVAGAMLQEGRTCAWKGCHSHYQGDMPKGWRCVAVYTDEPYDGEIDGVLCPTHVGELGKNLILGYKLDLAITEENRSEN